MMSQVRLGAFLFLLAATVCADGPVGWRSDGTGRFPTATPPTEWSKNKNVLWKVALPGASYGSPIVVGDNLYVVSDPADLLCVRRSDGKVLWKKSVSDVKGGGAGGKGGGKGGKGGKGGGKGGGMGGRGAGNSAATPVSDGKHVAAVFGNGVVAVYDLEGKRAWARFVESSQIGFGHAASPLLLGGKVIVHIRDLVALDVKTGKEAWRATTQASHASPVAVRVGGEALVISPAGAVVRVKDGKVLGKGAFRATEGSPVVDGEIVYVQGGRLGTQALKLSLDADGKASFKSLWSAEGTGGGGRDRKLPSSVLHDGLLYTATTSGFLEVIDAKKGEQVYRQRLQTGQLYSSLALAGGNLYAVDTAGKAVVFKPGRKFERVATNQLEGTGSCPVFAGDHLYLRGRQNLYCVSAKAPKGKAKDDE